MEERRAGETRHGAALAAVTVIFFLWGFLTCLNDILVPHLKAVFDLGYARGALVQFAFFSAYFLVSLPAGRVVARVGYKGGLVAGLALAGAGAVLFYPAASVPSYALFLSALFVLASGIVFLQVAANAYVAVLGPPEGAPSRLNLTQAFNALGTTLAPFFGGYLFLAHGGTGDHLAEARAVRLPYLGLAVVLFVVAAATSAMRLPRVPAAEGTPGGGTLGAALRVRHLALGALAIFAYVGAEVSIGSFLVMFLERPEIGGLDPLSAARYVAIYWGGAMVGRFAGALVLRRVPAGRLLAGAAALAGSLVLVARTHRLGDAGDGGHPRRRRLQLDHVSHHLHPRHRRSRAPHEPRVEPPRHGRRRRGRAPRRVRRRRRPPRPPAGLRPPGARVPLHRLLRCARLTPVVSPAPGHFCPLVEARLAPLSAFHHPAQVLHSIHTSTKRVYRGATPKRAMSGARKSPITPRAMSACTIA